MSVYDDAVLAMIPSGYKEGTLYSQIPNTAAGDFTVGRDSWSMRVNSDGYLERLLEDVPCIDYRNATCPSLFTWQESTNLITYPISFDNAYWIKSGATIDDNGGVGYQSPMLDFSYGSDELSGWTNGDFDSFTSSGTDITQMVSGGLGNNCYSSIVAESGKTYKLQFTSSQDLSTNCQFRFSNSINLTSAYVPVLSIPSGRNEMYFTLDSDYDYCGFYGMAAFTNTQITDFTITEVTGTSTTPLREAYKLVEDGTTGTHRIYKTVSGLTGGNTYTATIYAKANERDFISIYGYDGYGGYNSYFDVTNGIVGTTNVTSNITAVANGWYKCSSTFTLNASASGVSLYYQLAAADASTSYTGDGTSGIYIAYAQLEQQSTATPFIYPTAGEGSTYTRVADAITGAGDATTFSSVNSSGAIVFEYKAHSISSQGRITLSDNTNNNRIFIEFGTIIPNSIRVYCTANGTTYVDMYSASATITDKNVIGIRWIENDVELWVNGSEVASDNSYTPPTSGTFNELNLADIGTSNNLLGCLDKFIITTYPSDATMSLLTSQ